MNIQYSVMIYFMNSLKKINILILLIFVNNLLSIDFEILLKNEKNQPVPEARIIIMETKESQFTDKNGVARFSVEKLGSYNLRIVLPDGIILQPGIQVLGNNQRITLFSSQPKELKEALETKEAIVSDKGVVITGRRNKQSNSVYTVQLEEIKRIPGQLGEALRGIENLPGVNVPPFGFGEIILRGANGDSNSYYVDDLPIAYPYHLIPINSVIQNDFINTIDVYTGSYPARFGDATGGVIAIYTPDRVEKFGGNAVFSLWATSVLFQGPFSSTGGYYIAGARVSYLHETFKSFLPNEITAVPKYQDAQIKFRWNLTKNQSFYFYFIGSKDTFVAKVKDNPFNPLEQPPVDLIGLNAAANLDFATTAIRHIYQPSSRFYTETTLLYYIQGVYLDASVGNISAKFKRTQGYSSLKNESSYELINNILTIETGLEARNFIYSNKGNTVRIKDPLNPNPNPYKTDPPDFEKVPIDDFEQAPFYNAYILFILKTKYFEFLPGARYEYFSLNKSESLDPKGTFKIKLTEKFSIIGGGGIYRRLPGPNEFSETSGNPDIRFEKASHSSGGFEYKENLWTFKIEGFQQYYEDLVVGDPYITTPVKINLDPIRRWEEPILYNAPLYFSNKGTGYSYGAELFIRKEKPPFKNGFYGWLSYTHSITKRRDHLPRLPDEIKNQIISANERRLLQYYDNSKEFSADFDRRHIINLVIGWKINSEYQVGLRWRYSTSQPYTQITGDDGGITKNGNYPIFEPKFSEEKNTIRLKPYHRIDLRFDRFLNYEWGYGNVFLELVNAYIRRNEGGFSFDKSIPFSPVNPQKVPEFDTLEVPIGENKTTRIPLFNFGIEVKF